MIASAITRGLFRSLTTPSLRLSSQYVFERDIPSSSDRKKMNLFQAVNDAMDLALASDKT